MKNSLLVAVLLLVFSGHSFSQDFEISKIDWEGETKTENDYIELLDLKDKNALIVKVGYSLYAAKDQESEFIVYQNDGKVKRFAVSQSNSTDFKTKVVKRKVKSKNYEYYWKYLQECINENKFKIDKSKLALTEKRRKKGKATQNESSTDGAHYHFQVYQGKNYISYGSHEPEAYIENKYPGFEERKKLVDLMNGFEQLAGKY